MRVRFSHEVMADTTSWRALDRMVMHFEDGRHDWLADNPVAIEASAWMQDGGRIGGSNRKALEEHIRMAAYPKTRAEVTIVLATVSANFLGAADALRLLETPAYVAMENVTADGGFLETVINALGRVELWNALEKGWLSIYQMGGFGEVEKVLAHICRNVPGPCRVFVLADSDAEAPGQVTATHQKVADSCKAAGAPYAVLRKRKIENYLPVSVLNRLGGRRESIVFQAFLALNSDQRAHYEMKHGFPEDGRGGAFVAAGQATLFAGVRGPVLRDLCGGFGKRVAERFRDDREKITEADIRQVCDSDPTELDRIVDQIEKLL